MSNRTPQYRRYRGKYASVKIDGKLVHLGLCDSPESKAKYKRLITQWAAEQAVTDISDETLSVAELLDAYRRFAESYYGNDRESRYRRMLSTIRYVRELYADIPAG